MTLDMKTAAAGLLALAGMLTLPLGTAEARSWRSYAHQYGGGYYVDKYASKYVGEDKNGHTYYKGSKHDKWSGEYYNNKTGKWTGKTYDGEWGGKSSSTKFSSKSSGSDAPAVKSGSAGSKKTNAAKTTSSNTAPVKTGVIKSDAGSGSSTAVRTVKKAAPEVEPAEAQSPPAEATPKKGPAPQAKLVPQAEVYGPPMPPAYATAEAQ